MASSCDIGQARSSFLPRAPEPFLSRSLKSTGKRLIGRFPPLLVELALSPDLSEVCESRVRQPFSHHALWQTA